MHYRKILLTIHVLPAILCILSCSLTEKKEDVKVIGFAYKGDLIIITSNKKNILRSSITGVEDENGICSFNQRINLDFKKEDAKLNILAYSRGIKVLDTLLSISKNSKEPFISFIYPSMAKRKNRSVFIADATDSNYIKY